MKFSVLPIILTFACLCGAQTPAAVEREIIADLDKIDKYSTYLGEYDESKNDQANEALRDRLVRNGKSLEILHYPFPKLKDKMYVATSVDGKLRIYSWDLGTGGTMHDFTCVYQFQAGNGAVNIRTESGNDEGGCGGYYTQIFQVSSKDGPIYLAISTSIAQGNLHGQSIEGLRIIGDRLDVKPKIIRTRRGLVNSVDFVYDPSSLGQRSERLIVFDAAKQEFRFPVVVEDKTYGNGRVTSRQITYRFSGQYFVKVG